MNVESDFEYIKDLSGEGGALAQANSVFDKINDGLTGFFDSLLGPDATDAYDASCNTCKHFARKPMTAEEKRLRNIYGMPGECLLKQIPTNGFQRGIYCGWENEQCYENRRTGKRPADIVTEIREIISE